MSHVMRVFMAMGIQTPWSNMSFLLLLDLEVSSRNQAFGSKLWSCLRDQIFGKGTWLTRLDRGHPSVPDLVLPFPARDMQAVFPLPDRVASLPPIPA